MTSWSRKVTRIKDGFVPLLSNSACNKVGEEQLDMKKNVIEF